jgi:hypothetical protein
MFSGAFRRPVQSYRAYRFNNCAGNPLQPPAIAVRRSSANHYNLYASWNGSTRVTAWRVLASSSQRGRFSRVDSRGFTGFETRVAVSTRRTCSRSRHSTATVAFFRSAHHPP